MVILLSLLVLTMFSFYMVGNILAKYSTESETVEKARVAKFKITETGVSEININSENFRPGYTLIQPIEINNDSEVAIDYTLTVEILTDNLPISLTLDGQTGRRIVINRKLEPGSLNENYDLYVNWPIEENSPDYAMMVDAIKLSVNAVQID